MTNWFTVETIDKDTFVISEYRHWEETHCYLICGTEKAVLIDTGLGIGNIKSVVDSLTSLPIMSIGIISVGISILRTYQFMRQRRNGYRSDFQFLCR